MMETLIQVLLKGVAVVCAVGACAGTVAFIVLCDYLMHKETMRAEK